MKKIIGISASNIITAKNNSASTKTCQLVKEHIEKIYSKDDFVIAIIELSDYDLKSCIMCEKCITKNRCYHDEDFNKILNKLATADGIYFVIPHYAGLPSKLVIMFEKLEEIFYLNYCKGNDYRPIDNVPVVIIAHGGMMENYEDLYLENLLGPVKNIVLALGLQVVKLDGQPGVMFGVENYYKKDKTVTPGMEHNWQNINNEIKPLINKFLDCL